MAPPTFADLGKQARDLFGKGYHFGLWKLDVKTKTASGIEFLTSGHSEHGKVFGSIGSKYKIPDFGLILTESWDTKNNIHTDITIKDKLVDGIQLTLETTFAPQTGERSGKFRVGYGNKLVQIDSDASIHLRRPPINASAVVGYKGLLAGYKMALNSKHAKFVSSSFAVDYMSKDYTLHLTANDAAEFGASIYQKCSRQLDFGVQLSWAHVGRNATFAVAGKYQLDDNTILRAKVNNRSQLGLSYQQFLNNNILITLSSLIDANKHFNSGGHKIGIALEMDFDFNTNK